MRVLYAEVKAPVGKSWDSKIWDRDIWRNGSEDAGTEEPLEPSELAEEVLLFLVRGRASAVLEDAV